MAMRLVGAVVVSVTLACSLILAQDKKPTELQVAEAKLIKLQLEYLELQKQLATCQQQVVGGSAKVHEEKILKAVEAKPGQKFDWNTMTVTPVPTAPSAETPKNKP
jgi:hypothetical protein